MARTAAPVGGGSGPKWYVCRSAGGCCELVCDLAAGTTRRQCRAGFGWVTQVQMRYVWLCACVHVCFWLTLCASLMHLCLSCLLYGVHRYVHLVIIFSDGGGILQVVGHMFGLPVAAQVVGNATGQLDAIVGMVDVLFAPIQDKTCRRRSCDDRPVGNCREWLLSRWPWRCEREERGLAGARGLKFVTVAGVPTRWGVWAPEKLNGDQNWSDERGVNSVQVRAPPVLFAIVRHSLMIVYCRRCVRNVCLRVHSFVGADSGAPPYGPQDVRGLGRFRRGGSDAV